MSELISAGLAHRKNDKYFLTSLGRIVYKAHLLIGTAANNYSKLKANDSIESGGIPVGERDKIIYSLIDESRIMEILVSPVYFRKEKALEELVVSLRIISQIIFFSLISVPLLHC